LLALFTFALLVQMGGGWSISIILRRMHKTEMHSRIKNGSKGVSIWLTHQEFHNLIKEEDEIQIGDQFYDIIEITHEGNLVKVEALHDTKEGVLKDIQKTGRGKGMLLHLAKIFTPLFMPESTIKFTLKKFILPIKHSDRMIGFFSKFHPQETIAPPDEIL